MDFIHESTGVVTLCGRTRSTKYGGQNASVFWQLSLHEERLESRGADQELGVGGG
jgi:hypothetical protein